MRAVERFFNAPFWAIVLFGVAAFVVPGLILATPEPVFVGSALLLLALLLLLRRQWRAEHRR